MKNKWYNCIKNGDLMCDGCKKNFSEKIRQCGRCFSKNKKRKDEKIVFISQFEYQEYWFNIQCRKCGMEGNCFQSLLEAQEEWLRHLLKKKHPLYFRLFKRIFNFKEMRGV